MATAAAAIAAAAVAVAAGWLLRRAGSEPLPRVPPQAYPLSTLEGLCLCHQTNSCHEWGVLAEACRSRSTVSELSAGVGSGGSRGGAGVGGGGGGGESSQEPCIAKKREGGGWGSPLPTLLHVTSKVHDKLDSGATCRVAASEVESVASWPAHLSSLIWMQNVSERLPPSACPLQVSAQPSAAQQGGALAAPGRLAPSNKAQSPQAVWSL